MYIKEIAVTKLFKFPKIFINEEKKNSLVIIFILVLAVLCSIFSFWYYYSHGLTLTYVDAKAHLNIARRVIFSLTPGIPQLGGIWLPLPHVLDILSIWNNNMYYSGISGSIISMTSYIIAAILIFKSLNIYTKSLLTSSFGALIFLFNPAFLYFQTTPMTEPLAILASVAVIYYIIKWSKTDSLITLITAGILAMVATLCRYDNWFLVIATSFVVFLITILKKRKLVMAESNFLVFFVPAIFGILLWLLYNFLIFGSPLFFANGIGSASWFATNQFSQTKHNFYLSLITFIWLAIENVGIISIILMALGIILVFVKNKLKPVNLAVYLFLIPLIFNIISLYFGQSIAETKYLAPFVFYNTRYGLNALPAVAVFIPLIFFSFRKSVFLILPLLVIQYYLLFTNPLPVLNDLTGIPISGESVAANWLKENPQNGLALISTGTFDRLVFDAQIHEEKIVYEGSGKYWKESLEEPEKIISRVLTGKNVVGLGKDPVGKGINFLKLQNYYHVVFRDNYVTVYDRNF